MQINDPLTYTNVVDVLNDVKDGVSLNDPLLDIIREHGRSLTPSQILYFEVLGIDFSTWSELLDSISLNVDDTQWARSLKSAVASRASIFHDESFAGLFLRGAESVKIFPSLGLSNSTSKDDVVISTALLPKGLVSYKARGMLVPGASITRQFVDAVENRRHDRLGLVITAKGAVPIQLVKARLDEKTGLQYEEASTSSSANAKTVLQKLASQVVSKQLNKLFEHVLAKAVSIPVINPRTLPRNVPGGKLK